MVWSFDSSTTMRTPMMGPDTRDCKRTLCPVVPVFPVPSAHFLDSSFSSSSHAAFQNFRQNEMVNENSSRGPEVLHSSPEYQVSVCERGGEGALLIAFIGEPPLFASHVHHRHARPNSPPLPSGQPTRTARFLHPTGSATLPLWRGGQLSRLLAREFVCKCGMI